MTFAYYAIIPATADLSAFVPVLGWAAIDLTVRESGNAAAPAPGKSALMSGSVPVSPKASISRTHTLTDVEAQEQADRYAGETRHAMRLTISDEDWAKRPTVGAVLENGIIRQGEPTITPVPLKEQARSAMSSLMHSTQSNGWGVFAPMPDTIATYGKALSVIVSGVDTSSTTLPTVPDELKQ